MTTIDTSTEAVERLLKDVTPGPWQSDSMFMDQYHEVRVAMPDDCGVPMATIAEAFHNWNDVTDVAERRISWKEAEANARFIAAARDLVPALLKERDEARARVRALEEITDPDFIWGAMDNVHDMDVTLDDYAKAVSRAQRAAIAAEPLFNCRRWPFFPIEMPLTAEGKGPATIGEDASRMTYEVWDMALNTYSSHDYLPDAINEAMRLSFGTSQPADPVTNAGCHQPVRVKPLEAAPAPVRGAVMAEKLKPCPFCGGDDLYFPHGTDHAVIECSGCGARSGVPDDQTEVEATAKWNVRVAPSLRITGPNSDGEYWLHIKAGGLSGGVNLGGERGPICKRLLDAASETGAKE